MRLENFQIASSIELQFDGKLWDLHNSAYFQGLRLVPRDNAALMEWVPSSSPGLSSRSGMKLLFEGLQFVQIGARDSELPLTEDVCVADILKVNPSVQHSDPYMRPVPESSDHFRLVFSFQSRRIIEIGSDSVRLIPVDEAGLAVRHL